MNRGCSGKDATTRVNPENRSDSRWNIVVIRMDWRKTLQEKRQLLIEKENGFGVVLSKYRGRLSALEKTVE